ncbi:MAG: hypothetical protein ACK4KW_10035 [Gemmobacter sp.]
MSAGFSGRVGTEQKEHGVRPRVMGSMIGPHRDDPSAVPAVDPSVHAGALLGGPATDGFEPVDLRGGRVSVPS